MATAQGQDVIRCQLCSNPVEHHCNLCHVNLCLSCIPEHMIDKSKKHEIVEYTSRKKDTIVLPMCPAHKKNRCETYCQECKIPVCIQCLMGLHKKHEFTDINDILKKHKQIILADIKEMVNTILPKYRNVNPTSKFEEVLKAIEEQEQNICKAVHDAGVELKDKVTKEMKEAVKKSKESQSLAKNAEKEIIQIIQNNNSILKGNDATAIIKYQSKNLNFRKGPELPEVIYPQLLPGVIKQDQIVYMYGFLKTGDDTKKRSFWDLPGRKPRY